MSMARTWMVWLLVFGVAQSLVPGVARSRLGRVGVRKAEEAESMESMFAAQRAKREEPVDQMALFRKARNQLVGDHAFLSAAIAA